MIIGIAGPTASGKTTVAHMLAKQFGAFRIKYSDLLSQMAFERGLDAQDKATLQNLYLSERQVHGEDFLAKEMERKLCAEDSENIIVEGNRRLVDIPMLKRVAESRNDPLVLLYIDASPDTRFARYNERLEKHGELPVSREAFDELEANKAEDELTALREMFEKEGVVIASDAHTPEEVFEEVQRSF